MSKIQWTEKTWNPTTGCTLLSPGCDHCYAKTMSHRLMLMGQSKYRNDFQLTLHPDTLDLPRTWKTPQMVFVNSMSDLFHADVPLEYIQRVFQTMRGTPHTYQILTKRSGRLLAYSDQIDWPDNVWMGVSVESEKYVSRAMHLSKTRAKTKFISYEPALGPVNFRPYLPAIDWVIVGGESGHGARPFNTLWASDVLWQCKVAGVACFIKQLGAEPMDSSMLPGERLKLKDGKGGDINEWPQDLRVREFPRS